MTKKVKNPYQCKVCEGDKMVQSENGNKLIECPNCEGKGNYKPYDTN
jgi:DnaJ-class molecular chaperone|tara:strand:- start:239 stop:379 length:141 start_codon:yes stop_codon:yes gene_type:complete